MRTMWSGRGPAPVAIVLELVVTAGPAAAVVDVSAAPTAAVARASATAQISRRLCLVPTASPPDRCATKHDRHDESMPTVVGRTTRETASRASLGVMPPARIELAHAV